MSSPPELKWKVLDALRQEPSPVRAQVARRERLLACTAVLVPLLLFLVAGGVRVGHRPLPLVLLTAAGVVLIAGLALRLALERGSSLLGLPRAWLVGVAVGAPLLFLAWKTAVSASFPGMTDAVAGRIGYRCLGLTALFAAWPFFVLALRRRGSDPTHPRSLGAALGVAAGAAAVALVDLWCPVAHLPHLLLGHVLPVALLGLVGVIVAPRVLAIRSR
jgi:hypothetical protein